MYERCCGCKNREISKELVSCQINRFLDNLTISKLNAAKLSTTFVKKTKFLHLQNIKMAVPITGDDVYKRKKLTITKQKECVAQNRNELCTEWTDLQYFSKTEIGRRKISLSPILTVLFIIFLLKLNTESFKARTRIKLKTKDTTKKKAPGILQLKSGWIFDNIIKPWRCFPRNVYHAYPFLPQETSSHFNGRQIPSSANMQFEGARFATFATFPYVPGIFATRLAEAGFYYTGIGNEVICFSCGVRHSCWRHHDSAFEIHKRISPNCPFISDEAVKRKEGNQNFHESMDNNIKEEKIYPHTSSETGFEISSSSHGSGTSQLSNPTNRIISAENVVTPGFLTSDNQSLVETSEIENKVKKSELNATGNVLKESTPGSALRMEGTSSSELLEIGVCLDKAKYPKYALRSNRIDSFKHWPSYLTQTPEEMATAGFFFTVSIRSLEEENQNLKDQQTCKICLDKPIAIVFLPCGHMASCANCAPALRRCPICRVFIKGTVKAIMC
ncbi:BIRC2_3 [Mytilus coruscus]|uniref:BIRC2_3 n=1 Tax=Mytilus coruscus TaxID=42192 RepID=A0A6J8AWR7_MYTCO|nr:BIRC2_3 [Mytilus coruscus]